jgi:NADP-dependent 3-hydroxy acid dehydrogenase YdfG
VRFENTVLFATGGGSGLSAATARRFADEGAKVVIADIDTTAAEEVAGSLPDALAATVDTADAASVAGAIAAAVDRYGRVDAERHLGGEEQW